MSSCESNVVRNTILNRLEVDAGWSFQESQDFELFTTSDTYEKVVILLERLKDHHNVVVVHDNDPDGFCSAAILRKCLEKTECKNVNYIAVTHGKPFSEFSFKEALIDADVAFILDHGCSFALQEHLAEVCPGEVVIIDHHPETDGNGPCTVIASTRWSTTMLTSGLADNYLDMGINFSSVPCVVNHYDSWRFGKDSNYDDLVKSFMAAVFHLGANQTKWDTFFCSEEGPDLMVSYILKGLEIREYQRVTIDRLIKKAMVRLTMPSTDQGKEWVFGVIFHSDLIDTLANEALESDPSLDFVLIVYSKGGPHPYKLSFRSSNERVDVSAIARSLGGGGHRNASGVNADHVTLTNFLSSTKVFNHGQL